MHRYRWSKLLVSVSDGPTVGVGADGTETETSNGRAALSGLRVVEFAHVIAGPLAGTLLADMGAEVIHVEDPEHGDPGRLQGPRKDGVPLWWKVSARNKRLVTLDLRADAGQQVARRLAAWADVVIVNFRDRTLRGWGLDYVSIQAVNPRVVYLQVSGFGLNTSRRDDPGFGKVGEARSGVVHVTGFPDGPPVHTGFSHGDSVAALMGAFAVQCALWRRERDPGFRGEHIDLALNDALFRLVEWQIICRDQLGEAPTRSGNRLAVAPAAVINTYEAGDGEWVTVTSGTPRSVQEIAEVVGFPADLVQTSQLQAEHAADLDTMLARWVALRPGHECEETLTRAGVAASRILDAGDILRDDTYAERGAIVTVVDEDLGPVQMQNVVPRLINHPGRVATAGGPLGRDDAFVYGPILGMGSEELERLRDEGVVAPQRRQGEEWR